MRLPKAYGLPQPIGDERTLTFDSALVEVTAFLIEQIERDIPDYRERAIAILAGLEGAGYVILDTDDEEISQALFGTDDHETTEEGE